MKKHAFNITGFPEEMKITDGKSLMVASLKFKGLDDFIREFTFKICGIHPDDVSDKEIDKDSGDLGEMTEGE